MAALFRLSKPHFDHVLEALPVRTMAFSRAIAQRPRTITKEKPEINSSEVMSEMLIKKMIANATTALTANNTLNFLIDKPEIANNIRILQAMKQLAKEHDLLLGKLDWMMLRYRLKSNDFQGIRENLMDAKAAGFKLSPSTLKHNIIRYVGRPDKRFEAFCHLFEIKPDTINRKMKNYHKALNSAWQHEKLDIVMKIIESMRKNNIKLNSAACDITLIKAFQEKNADLALDVFNQIKLNKKRISNESYKRLLLLLSPRPVCLEIYKRAAERSTLAMDIDIANAMLAVYANISDVEKALTFWSSQFENRLSPNLRSYELIIASCCRSKARSSSVTINIAQGFYNTARNDFQTSDLNELNLQMLSMYMRFTATADAVKFFRDRIGEMSKNYQSKTFTMMFQMASRLKSREIAETVVAFQLNTKTKACQADIVCLSSLYQSQRDLDTAVAYAEHFHQALPSIFPPKQPRLFAHLRRDVLQVQRLDLLARLDKAFPLLKQSTDLS